MKQIYEVWSEGYIVQGNNSDAQYHGKFEGETFQEAIATFRDTVKDPYSRSCIDIEKMNYWGCRFFDNETDARKSFG